MNKRNLLDRLCHKNTHTHTLLACQAHITLLGGFIVKTPYKSILETCGIKEQLFTALLFVYFPVWLFLIFCFSSIDYNLLILFLTSIILKFYLCKMFIISQHIILSLCCALPFFWLVSFSTNLEVNTY